MGRISDLRAPSIPRTRFGLHTFCELEHLVPSFKLLLESILLVTSRRKPPRLKMLRTTISTAGARTAARFPYTLRSNFRPFDIATSTLRSAPRRTFTSSKSSTSFTFSSNSRPILRNSTILQRLQNSVRNFRTSRRRYNGASATPSEEPTSLGGRLKKLGREYGWSALGVYFALSALDFPFCYLLVKYLGTERIGEFEFLFSWRSCVVSSLEYWGEVS